MADKLFDVIKKMHKEIEVDENSTEAEILRAKILKGAKTNEGYLEIERELDSFMESEPSQEDIDMIQQYICPFRMVCNAIREGKM